MRMTRKTAVACAEVRRDDGSVGFGSVGVGNQEAQDILNAVAMRHRCDTPLASGLFDEPVHLAAVEEILIRLEGRYIAGAAETPDAAADGDVLTLSSLNAHQNAWGRLHRLIEVTCDPVAMRVYAGAYEPTLGFRLDGPDWASSFWKGWRLAGPIRQVAVEEAPAVRLAQIVAAAAAMIASGRRAFGFEGVQLDLERSLDRHYLGALDLYPQRGADFQEWYDDAHMAIFNRLTSSRGPFTDRNDPIGLLRVSFGLQGSALPLEDHRDRFLLRLLGLKVPVAPILRLRVEALDVDAYDYLFEIPIDRKRHTFMHEMDAFDAPDLWALVAASEGLDGPLFAAIEEGTPYGRRPLSEDDVERIVASRALAHAIS